MKKRILLIIQNPRIQQALAPFLAEMGYTVKISEDGKTAMALAAQIMPDMIICDYNLPVISGRELARYFKRQDKFAKIPYLLIMPPHGPSMEEMARIDFHVDADDLIRLPLRQGELYGAITKWLETDERPTTAIEQATGPLADEPKLYQPKSWLRGKVNCATVGRLISNLLETAESGKLLIKGDRRKMRVLVHQGLLVDVESNYIREDTLGRFLVRLKKLPQKELEASMALAEKTDRPLGQILIQKDLLSKRELDQLLSQQKKMKFLRLFQGAWDNASYAFTPQPVVPGTFDMKPTQLTTLLKTGILQITPADELQKAFQKNEKEELPLQLTERFDPILRQFEFDAPTWEKARQVHGISIHQAKNLRAEGFEEFLRIGFFLVVTGAAEFGGSLKPKADSRQAPPVPTLPKAPSRQDRTLPQETWGKTDFTGWNAEAYQKAIGQARALFQKGDFTFAKPMIEKALSLNPDSTEALTLSAWTHFQLSGKGNIAAAYEAKELLKKAISLDDGNDMAFLYMGKILKQEGKETLAHTHFLRAHSLNPANEEAQREVKLIEIKRRKDNQYSYRR